MARAKQQAAKTAKPSPARATTKKAATTKKPAKKPAPATKPAKKPAPPKKPAPATKHSAKQPAPATKHSAPAGRKPAPAKHAAPVTKPAVAPAPAPAPRHSGGGQIVQILDDDQPIDALRQFLATIEGNASEQQGQVALGSAQLMLFAIEREHRGGPEVQDLVDLVLSRWDALPEQTGFHAQGFLRNALVAVGDDPDRIRALAARVPAEPTPELAYNLAAAYAFVGDKPAMLRALERAYAAGASLEQVHRDDDFATFAGDPELARVIAGAAVPRIRVDIRPHVRPVRAALDALVATLREYGAPDTLHPPATLDAVLAMEHAQHLQLPNDYRALLTITDGMKVWDSEFFGTEDFRADSALARRARAYLDMSAQHGRTGIEACIPIASSGQANDWLLYDPRGTLRGEGPGYVLMLSADELVIDDLASALLRLERIATESLATN